MASVNLDPRSRPFALLATALTILFLIVVQAHHFHDRPYRQDEAWVVDYALDNIERVGLIRHIGQIFRQVTPENFLQDIWVQFFGHHENVVRFGSTLTTVLALAIFSRLAHDLFSQHAAWLALVLLGTYSLFVYYGHEARPYAVLAFGAIGFQWALLRFIRLPTAKRWVLAFLMAAVPTYTHLFTAVVIIAQLICVLVFVKWERELYRRGAFLFLFIALSVSYRIYLNFLDRGGIIRYNVETSWDGLQTLYDWLRANPEILALLLLAGGAVVFLVKLSCMLLGRAGDALSDLDDILPRPTALDNLMRFPALWREGWLVLSGLLMLGIPLLANAWFPSLTPRNLLILAPTLALVAVVSLRHMPRYLQLLIVFFFCLPFVTQFRSLSGNAGYWELTTYIEERMDADQDRLVIVAAQPWEIIPINYFLHHRMTLALSEQDIFSVSWRSPAEEPFAPPSFLAEHSATGLAEGDWERLRAFLGDSERIWVIKGNLNQGGQNMLAQLESEYSVYTVVDFPGETYYRSLEVLEYRRQPASVAEPLWRFGDAFNLLAWRLNEDHIVQPCSPVSVDTWWSLAQESTGLYSSTLVLVGEDGQGVSNADNVPGGAYLTSIWQRDQRYFDERELLIPCDLAEGDYSLVLGMYQLPAEAGEAVENLPVFTAAGEPTGRTYEYLTTLTVRP